MPKFRAWINGLTTTDLADDDRFATVDASTSGTVHTKWSLIKSTLQTAFDSRYASVADVGDNLVYNGDFTSDAPIEQFVRMDPAYPAGVLSRVTTDSVVGGASLSQSKATGSQASGIAVFRAFPVEAGKTYRLSFWVKSDAIVPTDTFYSRLHFKTGTPTDGFIYVTTADATLTTTADPNLEAVLHSSLTSWTEYEWSFTVPAGMKWCSPTSWDWLTSTNTLLISGVRCVADEVAASDTGWRNLTADLANGWTASQVAVHRVGNTVSWAIVNLNGASATDDRLFADDLIAGFEPKFWSYFDLMKATATGTGQASVNMAMVAVRHAGARNLYGPGGLSGSLTGHFSHPTVAAVPDALPGSAL